ncbi:MAG: GNAT family N-acetyltransferase [Myxococcota bacterium]
MADAYTVGIVGAEFLPDCWQIRRQVFIDGQDVPESLEVDGLDEQCVHALVRVEGVAVGTARLRRVGSVAKVERVAVLETHRGLGLGRTVMGCIEAEAARRGWLDLKLNAQKEVVQFYLELGYKPVGDEFVEADIVHQAMVKRLT